MARSLSTIFNEAKEQREKYLALSGIVNESKMSVMDAFTWITSTCIWMFENLLDVFQVDLARDIEKRFNGTAAYYVNALLKYQHGDELIISHDGTQFSYPNIDEEKRIISSVAYSEVAEDGFYDKTLLLKVAKGKPGNYKQLDSTELAAATGYMRQISFAGTHFTIVSRKGDVLMPRMTVYYNPAISETQVLTDVKNALQTFVQNLNFSDAVYIQKIVDAVQSVSGVEDVEFAEGQGIFVAQYDDDNNLIPQEVNADGSVSSYAMKSGRYFIPNSGYLRESTGIDMEELFDTWDKCLILKPEQR